MKQPITIVSIALAIAAAAATAPAIANADSGDARQTFVGLWEAVDPSDARGALTEPGRAGCCAPRTAYRVPCAVPQRGLRMASLSSSVVGFKPSRSAAPPRPLTFQRAASSASRMCWRS